MDKLTFLIVENDLSIAKMMSMVIRSLGHTFEITSDGQTGCDLIYNNTYDIVIADINASTIGGLHIMAGVLEYGTTAPDFIISGFSSDYNYKKIIGGGAKDFLKKPLTIDEFSIKLERFLKERELVTKNSMLQQMEKDLNKRLATLIEVAYDLTSELDYKKLFPLIIGKVTEIMAAERSSLYVIDWERNELWTEVAEGVEQIRVPIDSGICGHVAQTGEILNASDAWTLPYFNRDFDKKNNFRTKSVLCIPIRNRVGERIGVLQVINKIGAKYFDKNDEIFLKGLASQVSISLENSLLHQEIRRSFDSSIITLSAIVDARHPFTAGHSERVTEYSLMIAKEMILSKDEIEILKYAALLHDIGKIGIRDKVLLKNGRFNADDRTEMNSHPAKTKAILDNFRFPKLLKEVPSIAAHHHEKINGEGYPYGLTGSEIHLGSKIIAVADVFDALTSKRDYPKYDGDETMSTDPMPIERAVNILEKDAGSHFDPDVIDAFLKCLPQALFYYRGNHFPKKYVDDIIKNISPELIKTE